MHLLPANRVARALTLAGALLAASACGQGDSEAVASGTQATALSTSLYGLTVTLSSSGPLVQGVDDTFTWTVRNDTTSVIANITVASNWADDGGSNPVTKALAPGCGTQSGSPLGIYCGTVTLAPGASVREWAVVDPQKAGPVHYNAYALYPSSAGLVTAEVFDTESAGPGATDVQVTGSSNQGAPALNSRFTYTFQVKNNGPWPTSGGVSFSDVLPASLGFVAVTTSAGGCTGGPTVACALGDLVVGGQATIGITVAAPATPGTVVNTASAALTSPQVDSKTANDVAGVTVSAK